MTFVGCFAFTLLLLCGLAGSSSGISQEGALSSPSGADQEETDRLKAIAANWRTGIKSFSGEYDLAQIRADGSESQWRVTFRCQSNDKLLRLNEIGLDNRPESDKRSLNLTHVAYDGKFRTITAEEASPKVDYRNCVAWPVPWGVYLTPPEIMGQRHDLELTEVLAEGRDVLLRRNDIRILSHRSDRPDKSVDMSRLRCRL